jgi:hypothetical protein
VAQTIPLQSAVAMATCPDGFREREAALWEFVAGGGDRRRRRRASDSGSGSDGDPASALWQPETVFVCTTSHVLMLRMVPTVMQVRA